MACCWINCVVECCYDFPKTSVEKSKDGFEASLDFRLESVGVDEQELEIGCYGAEVNVEEKPLVFGLRDGVEIGLKNL